MTKVVTFHLKAMGLSMLFVFHALVATVGQNLVPNPGFEQYHNLPTEVGEWCATKYWDNLNDDCEYDIMASGSPDYLHEEGDYPVTLPNSGFSDIIPFEGKSILGLVLWLGVEDSISYREYISTNLSSPMQIGEMYTISLYTSNGMSNIRYGGYGTNNFGIYFSIIKPNQVYANPILVSPQLEISEIYYSNNWEQISFSFTPDQPYEYISIGNFRENTETNIEQFESYSVQGTAYYYIDEVCVIKEGDDCSVLTTSLNSAIEKEQAIQFYPNPVSSDLLTVSSNNIDLKNSTAFIYNAIGQVVYGEPLDCFDKSCQVSTESLRPGIYVLTIKNDSFTWSKKFIRL